MNLNKIMQLFYNFILIRSYMSIIKKISNGNSIIWIWKIEESTDELSILTNQTTDIKNEIKKKEFYASRILIEKICDELNIDFLGIKKDDNEKPHLIGSKYHISISHKFPYVTSIFDNKACGVDIERIDNKVRKIKSKFLTENEEKKIGDNLKKLVEYWSIKESTYKVEGKTIPLKKINVNQKSKSLYESLANGKNFELSVLEIDNHILSYTT